MGNSESPSTSSASGSSESSTSGDGGADPDGAEPADPPAPTASGSAPAQHGGGANFARGVRDAAAGARSGAEQVDFNEGQEGP